MSHDRIWHHWSHDKLQPGRNHRATDKSIFPRLSKSLKFWFVWVGEHYHNIGPDLFQLFTASKKYYPVVVKCAEHIHVYHVYVHVSYTQNLATVINVYENLIISIRSYMYVLIHIHLHNYGGKWIMGIDLLKVVWAKDQNYGYHTCHLYGKDDGCHGD